MARRAQLGAGIAAGVFSLLGLLGLLFAPVVPGCLADVSFTDHCPPAALRYVPLPQANLGADAWALLIGLALVLLLGAAGAIWDARAEHHLAPPLLWVGTILAFAACSLAARGLVGLAYLPAVLALTLAASASLARRQLIRPPERPASEDHATVTATPAPLAEQSAQPPDGASERPNQ